MNGKGKPPVQREKVEQTHVVSLLETFGGKVYVIGTRRPAGKRCPKCGEFVREHQGTCQTPGIADLLAFMPSRRRERFPTHTVDDLSKDAPSRRVLFVECKAVGANGRMNTMSPDQREFRDLCVGACTDHVVGGLNEVIAWLCANGYARADQFPHYRTAQISACSQTG